MLRENYWFVEDTYMHVGPLPSKVRPLSGGSAGSWLECPSEGEIPSLPALHRAAKRRTTSPLMDGWIVSGRGFLLAWLVVTTHVHAFTTGFFSLCMSSFHTLCPKKQCSSCRQSHAATCMHHERKSILDFYPFLGNGDKKKEQNGIDDDG